MISRKQENTCFLFLQNGDIYMVFLDFLDKIIYNILIVCGKVRSV